MITKGPKIEYFNITPIATVDPPLLNAAGVHAPYALRTVVELITDDGISGISEIPGNIATDQALERSKPLIIGQDPFQTNLIRDILIDHFGKDHASARGNAPWDQRKLVHIYSAIEVACLDIVGKIVGEYDFVRIGASNRERIPNNSPLRFAKKDKNFTKIMN